MMKSTNSAHSHAPLAKAAWINLMAIDSDNATP